MKHPTYLNGLIRLVSTLTAATAISGAAQSFLTDGLIANYRFDGNANDASGNGNNGTINGATLGQDRFGQNGMAYAFDGSSSFIAFNVPNIPTGESPRTVSLWAASQPDPTKGYNLFFWGADQVNRGFGLMNNGSPLIWDAEAWGNDVHSGVLVDTQWHHLVVAYDGAALSISIDGVQKATGARNLDTPFSNLTVGADLVDGTTFYRGKIDDIRIYDRALSGTEIGQLYAYEQLAPVPEPSEYAFAFGLLSLGTGIWLRYCKFARKD